MAEHFIALSTEDLRTMLETTWEAKGPGRLYDALKQQLLAANSQAAAGVMSEANNAHSATAFVPGSDRFTSTEYARGWQQLVELYRACNQFLTNCATNGFNAFQITISCEWPPFRTPQLAGPAAVMVDGYPLPSLWSQACLKYMVDYATVIGQPLANENAIYIWMMEQLVPVTQTRADRRWLFLNHGGYIT